MKWEYARSGAEQRYHLDTMNLMGKNGWELVAMLDGYCYFKRPIYPQREKLIGEQIAQADRLERERRSALSGHKYGYPWEAKDGV